MIATFNVRHHTPHDIDYYTRDYLLENDPTTGDTGHNLHTIITDILDNQLLTPLAGVQPVVQTTDNGKTHTLSTDDMTHIITTPFAENEDTVQNNKSAMNLLHQLTVNITPQTATLPVRRVFIAQQLGQASLPTPGPYVIYKAGNDIIPAAVDILNKHNLATGTFKDSVTAHHTFCASIGATFAPSTLGFSFLDNNKWRAFTTYFIDKINAHHAQGNITPNVMSQCMDLVAIDLDDLTEHLLIRQSPDDLTDDYSFARLFTHYLMDYVRTQHAQAQAIDEPVGVDVLPFDLEEWITPTNIVLINIDAHAHSNHHAVSRAWEEINAANRNPIKPLKASSITKLQSMSRIISNAQRTMQQTQRNVQHNNERHDISIDEFQEKAPRPIQIIDDIVTHLRTMGKVNFSRNPQQYTKKSLSRPSRRRPDDPNTPGKITTTRYIPDLHVFCDTSGSISIDDYQTSVVLLTQLAKKLGIDMYFSSFSHTISEELLLPTATLNQKKMAQLIERIPKVSGGTDFTQVWDYINDRSERKRRCNLMITDFEWLPSSRDTSRQPSTMLYAPCAVNAYDNYHWQSMTRSAADFATAMHVHDPHIMQRMMGMGVS